MSTRVTGVITPEAGPGCQSLGIVRAGRNTWRLSAPNTSHKAGGRWHPCKQIALAVRKATQWETSN